MIFIDTETTGLIQPKVIDLKLQPEIIEFAGIKTDNEFNEIERLVFICKPKLVTEIPIGASKVNGIYWSDVEHLPPFEANFRKLTDFVLGEEIMVAHNAAYDSGMLDLEIRRMGMEKKFPWPPIHHCTVQMVEEVGGFPKKSLGAVYEHMFHKKIEGQHRALADVEAMIEIYKELLNISKLKATPRVG